MRKKFYLTGLMMSFVTVFGALGICAEAKTEENVIENGIYIGEINVSGMTREQASQSVNAYVDSLLEKEIDLVITEGSDVTVTAADLGLSWTNPEVIEDAVRLAKAGNLIERYKAVQDLLHENQVFPLRIEFDSEKVAEILAEECAAFDIEAKDATIKRVDGSFEITEGQQGIVLDQEASLTLITGLLNYGWNESTMSSVQLVTEITNPAATAEDLSLIQDLLGSYSTSFKSSGQSRAANVTNGGSKIDGAVLMPGEEFSVYNAVKPFSEANGYYMAGSYLNGKVVDSIGGGICQVSTTLYNAVLQAELEVTMRYNHSMAVSYVEPSFDAAIAESSGKDFIFVNNTGYPVYIECYVKNKEIFINIYGVETRPANRVVTYENKILSTTEPDTEIIYQDGGQPAGFIDVTGAHIGYKAELYKVVTVDGVEESREKVNSSSYAMSPRSCVVGVATSNSADYEWLQQAIATGSIDQVKAVANAIAARNAAQQAEQEAAQQSQEQPPAQQPQEQPPADANP